MRFSVWVAGMLLVLSLPANARTELVPATPCRTQPLVDRLCVGMTKADAQAAYMGLDGKSQYNSWENRNEVSSSWNNPGKTISRLVIWYAELKPNELIARMTTKYGTPKQSSTPGKAAMSFGGPPVGTPITIEVNTWVVGNVMIEVDNYHASATYTIMDESKPVVL